MVCSLVDLSQAVDKRLIYPSINQPQVPNPVLSRTSFVGRVASFAALQKITITTCLEAAASGLKTHHQQ